MSASSPNSPRASRLALVGIYLAALLAVFVVANVAADRWRIQGREPPEYGTWTGVLEVERKVRLLREFAKEGPVDVLVLSSSMGDHGISAEVLTREISAAQGKPYRVFNFSMGGADLTTYPLVYRFARLVARPKEIWVVTPVSTSPVQNKEGLETKLLTGPVGRALRFPPLLALEHAVYDLPIVRNAAALRDWFVHRGFPNRAVSNLDLYEINRFGDTRSWLYNPPEYQRGREHIERHIDHIMKFVRQPNEVEHRKHHVLYFSPRVMGAVNDLKALAEKDGAKIAVVAFDSAVSLGIQDPEFIAASRRFFEPLAEYLGGRLIDVRTKFVSRPYMNADPIHFNIIGSTSFSRLLAASLTGRPAPEHVELAAEKRIRETLPDPSWKTFTAIVVKRASDPSGSLKLRYFQNWGVKRLRPFSNVNVVMRMVDGTDVVLPARVGADGLVTVDTSGLRFPPEDHVVTTQIVAKGGKMGEGMDIPVLAHEWSAERHPLAWYDEGVPEVRSASNTYSPLDQVEVAWRNLSDPMKYDWIGLYPVGGDGRSRVSFSFTKGQVEGKFTLPPIGRTGEFELRMFRNNGWESIATSAPIRVTEASGSVAVAGEKVVAGESLRVSWNGITHPHKQDWVGLFPKGAKDSGRIDFRYTNGSRDGDLQWPVPATVPPGEYEVRLFSSGGWTRLASSGSFSVIAPQR